MQVYFVSSLKVDYLPLLTLAFMVIISLVFYKKIEGQYYNFIKFLNIKKINFHFVSAILIFVFIVEVIDFIGKYSSAELIRQGKTYTLEGEIYNYKLKKGASRSESFKVKNTEFKYNNFSTLMFFSNHYFEDGIITDGRYIKIEYIKVNNSNRIFKLSYK